MFIRIADQIINADTVTAIRKYNEALYWYIVIDLGADDSMKFGPFTEDQADDALYQIAKSLNVNDLTKVLVPSENG